ncbi:DUF5677 domain-containing protein [Streptomyces sp. NPDC002992]|uniref:DUF5677 domain-containing protein n=1 Tax=Streptomyces sp. NPDC002992 TaxID=3154273 RepID=UPI0033A598FE
MPEFAQRDSTGQRAREVIRKLISTRDGLLARDGGVEFDVAHRAVAPSAWSWWNLITDSAQILLDEEVKGLGPVVAPVVRNLLSHALALQWLVEGGQNAVAALDAYSDDQLLTFIDEAGKRNWKLDFPDESEVREAINDRKATADPAFLTLKGEIGTTANLVDAYGVPRLYAAYRYLSAFSHTTRDTATLYVDRGDKGGSTPRDKPRQRDHNEVIWTAGALIQAGRVMDSILSGQPLTKMLDEATAYLGLPEDVLPKRREKRSRR